MSQDPNQPLSARRRRFLQGMAVSTVAAASMGGGETARGSEATRADVASADADVNTVTQLSAAQREPLAKAIKGKVYWWDEPGYELARASTAYRANKPNRFPRVVVRPNDDQDVVAAVQFAKANGLQVTTRSGGHSWSSSHIRDRVMLIDLSRMQSIDIDPKSKTLWVNPGVIGSRINSELKEHNLIIPTAHHPSPGIGGFCMNGGYGWNSRLWGNGAAHILAIDVVTADGKLIRADERQNSDFLWAARGSGAGFFGVITRMKLQAHTLPKYMKVSAYSFHAEVVEELFTWARNLVPKIPPYLEFIMSSTAFDSKTGEASPVRITMAALALTDSESDADAALDLLQSCPCLDQAYFRVEKKPTNLEERYASGYAADPSGYRFAADCVWTNAPAEVLTPRMRSIFCEPPTPHTHIFWFAWGPTRPYPKPMALSVQADVFIGAYTLWQDPAQDAEMEAWPVRKMRELEDVSVGAQMNDENMLHHPQRYLSAEAYAKLEELRAKHDPERVFASFLGVPYRTSI